MLEISVSNLTPRGKFPITLENSMLKQFEAANINEAKTHT